MKILKFWKNKYLFVDICLNKLVLNEFLVFIKNIFISVSILLKIKTNAHIFLIIYTNKIN